MKNIISSDFHSHILPCADHGSDSLEVSIGQLQIIALSGIKKVVATPHFYPMKDNVDTFLARRTACAETLASAKVEDIEDTEDIPEIYLGAEVLVCEGMERMDGLEKLAVCGTNCILLEMPTVKWSDALLDTIWEISKSGLEPVMAHIDRYDPNEVERLLSIGVKAQLNPNAFSGFRIRRLAQKWLAQGCVAALGSDLHGANAETYRKFIKATHAVGMYANDIENSMMSLLQGAKPIKFKK